MFVCYGLATRVDVGSLDVLNLIDMDERCLPVKRSLRDTGVREEACGGRLYPAAGGEHRRRS